MEFHKPTSHIQKQVIDSIVFIIKSWKGTNDISSPTHFGDIMEELNKFKYDGASNEYVDRLIDAVDSLFKLVRDADRHFEETE